MTGNRKTTRPHLVIRASAGTGKTFQLTNRYLELAAAGKNPETILATTFTRKGAGEILDRILYRLAEGATDEHKLAKLIQYVGLKRFDRRRCAQLLGQLVRQWPRLRIGTLDSFFIQIARSFALELGLPPGWQIVDETTDARLRDRAIQQLLEEQHTSDAVRLMNLLSRGEATQEVSQQIASLVENLYDVYVEAPKTAWHALQRRRQLPAEKLQAALQQLASVPVPGKKTLADAAQKALESARSGDWTQLLSSGLGAKIAAGEKTYSRQPIPDELAAALEPLVKHAKAVLVDQIADQTEATYGLLERFDAVYQRLKNAHLALRFEDVTRCLARSELVRNPAAMMYRIDAGVDHLLLDEFQDTNLLQWQILRPLAKRVVQDGSERSFFCVGDVKQAIYGWRGGVAEIFDALKDELEGLRTEPLNLNESYRCSPPVIETVNRVFGRLADNAALKKYPGAVKRWAARFTTHTTACTDLCGYCRLIAAPRAGEDQDQGVVTLTFAAGEVARLHQQIPSATVGVLVRKNESLARMIFQLRQLGIEASEEGGNPLADSPAVQLVLSLLKVADHPGDTSARFHVAHSPLGPAVGIDDLRDDAAAVRLSREIRRRLVLRGYGPTIFEWVEVLQASCDERDLNRLLQLVELAYAYQPQATLRADDFIAVVNGQRVEDPTAARVRVMTFHKAKGLEFDIVVLPELDVPLAGQQPAVVVGRPRPTAPVNRICRYVAEKERVVLPESFRRMFDEEKDQRVAEALCVLYVGLTRPKHALHMIVAPSKTNERSIPGTAAGVLRAALAGPGAAEPETMLYQWGEPAWFQRLAESKTAPEREAQTVTLRLAAAPRRPSRGLERRSPSQLEGGRRVDLARRLQLHGAESRNRGTLLHAWFEQIRWLEDGVPDEASLRRTAEAINPAREDLSALVAEFLVAIQKPAITALLSCRTYQEPGTDSAVHLRPEVADPQWRVYRELPFALRHGDAILSGQIDRLVLLCDGRKPVAADVVDFKTDAFSHDDRQALAERVVHYQPQLEAYGRAVAKRFALPLQRISARLAFVTPGIVVPVPLR